MVESGTSGDWVCLEWVKAGEVGARRDCSEVTEQGREGKPVGMSSTRRLFCSMTATESGVPVCTLLVEDRVLSNKLAAGSSPDGKCRLSSEIESLTWFRAFSI